MDRFKDEHPSVRFPTKEDILNYETEDLSVSNWIADRFQYITNNRSLPYFWSIEGIFVVDCCDLISFGDHGLSFKIIVSVLHNVY